MVKFSLSIVVKRNAPLVGSVQERIKTRLENSDSFGQVFVE